MSLAIDCLADYIIWHEVMHAIGFEHEHQRPDRDSFIHVKYSHVEPGQLGNFEKISSSEVDYPDTYDYKSIMHYDSFAFGKIDPKTRMRLATMTPLKKGLCTMGFYKLSMERQCALTCNLCKVRGVAITDKINRMIEVEDNDLDINIIKKEEKESAELSGTSCVDMVSANITFKEF
uniref:Metalloendopeptidase n=1 Tax=Heterorhabditis bacteriophora TaxID=37862 RepID=A0A1I7WN68_HETBA